MRHIPKIIELFQPNIRQSKYLKINNFNEKIRLNFKVTTKIKCECIEKAIMLIFFK